MTKFQEHYSGLDGRDKREFLVQVERFMLSLSDEERRGIYDGAMAQLSESDRANIVEAVADIYPHVPTLGERLTIEVVGAIGIFLMMKQYGRDTLRAPDQPAP